jgi:ADP-ribose pyrophosphatase
MIPEEAELVFKGTIFDVYHWQQKMFDGSFATFEMLRRPDTALVIPIDGDKIIVLDEYQPGTPLQPNRLVGGRIEPDESPLDCAKRELKEETGMEFANWALLKVVQPALKLEWFVYTYVAVNKISQVATAHEVGENITVKHISFDEFKQGRDAKGNTLSEINSIDELLDKVGLRI